MPKTSYHISGEFTREPSGRRVPVYAQVIEDLNGRVAATFYGVTSEDRANAFIAEMVERKPG